MRNYMGFPYGVTWLGLSTQSHDTLLAISEVESTGADMGLSV